MTYGDWSMAMLSVLASAQALCIASEEGGSPEQQLAILREACRAEREIRDELIRKENPEAT